jgi:hypothetical protein
LLFASRSSPRLLIDLLAAEKVVHLGGVSMSGQVILYFEDQADALRFALAAGSVMAGDSVGVVDNLIQETSRVSRIRLDAANAGTVTKPTPGCAA